MPPPDPDAPPHAFATPLERAQASGGPRDRISLTEDIREVEIGAFQGERGVTQRIRFDIVAEVMPAPEAVAGDDVDGILSYDTLIEAVDGALAAERVNLLETLAERIAARVLGHASAARVFVRIGKLDRGPYVLGVEIVRTRADLPEATRMPEAPRPRVLCLPAGAHAAGGLPRLLDRLAAEAPALLLATPDAPAPQAATATAQRRIDLLAIEQAAWQVAARDDRLSVVATRTELDWSLRQRRLALWAPGRIVGDATDAPSDLGPEALAAWIAARLDARDVTPAAAVAEALSS
ncbi:dihydroneopterin aldolase [uncultured Jannaschia sp.]|uniref:dihydroneopterin aldolase n=1 Tax=uncultured Jannaschia sp. TaxID=293347 RepID=UPI00261853F0|nr:dihydroneopterin aldolase [uncultured Jannaschia sp.]